MSRPLRSICYFFIPGFLLLLAACSQPLSQSVGSAATSTTPWGNQDSLTREIYVGNAACKSCHAAEFSSHEHTRHKKTLYEASQTELGALAAPVGPIPGGGKLAWEQKQLTIVVPAKDTGEPISVPLNLALGSGKTGMTYLALHEEGSLEIRQSYFPHEKKFIVTPGQQQFESSVVGQTHTRAETKRCIGCHAVTVPEALIPERKFFGVGCESCHGAGGAHVSAMQKRDMSGGLKLIAFSSAGGKVINEACGRCHRSPGEVARMDDKAKQSTSRFQPYGLSLSKCFTQSQDKLSCVTCHNPHEDASTDQRRYEKTCLSCHSAPKKVCPVNPTQKCVSCHMPTKGVFPGTNFPIKMADHFIRIYRDGKPTR